MKKINILAMVGLLVFALSGWTAYGHGEAAGTTGSGGMMNLMNMMHGEVDNNQAFNCDEATDEELMEMGEGMMDKMLGHEDHERIEEAMEVDMQDHDSMHMMMGMWSSGCVGENTASAIMNHYDINDGVDSGNQNQGSAQASWPSISLGVIIGAVGGWIVSRRMIKKPDAVV